MQQLSSAFAHSSRGKGSRSVAGETFLESPQHHSIDRLAPRGIEEGGGGRFILTAWTKIQAQPDQLFPGYADVNEIPALLQGIRYVRQCQYFPIAINDRGSSNPIRKRACRKERNNSNRPDTTHKCDFCGRDCFSHIGLYSHKRRCNKQTGQQGCTPIIKFDRRRPQQHHTI